MRARAVLAILSILTLAGCNLNTDYFKDYRGKNLLASYGFSATGKWNLLSDSTVPTLDPTYSPTDYMTWEAVGTESNDSSLGSQYFSDSSGSPAYRLEIKNLIPDGDFEAAGDTGNTFAQSGFWTASPSNHATFNSTAGTDTNGVPDTISNNTLLFGSTTVGDTLTLNLATAITTMALRTGNYRFHMDFYNASSNVSVPITLANPTATWDQTVSPTSTTPYSVSEEFASSASPTVTIGSTTSSQNTFAYIDNVRVVYTSIDPSIYVALPKLGSGGLTLLPGTKSGDYIFTFYIRDDPTANQAVTAHHVKNRLYPIGITVRFNAAQQPGSQTPSPFFIPRDSTWATGWQKITVSTGFNFVESDSQISAVGKTNALEIYLSPTQTNSTSAGGSDAGSLLIAEPSLVFNP